MKTSLFHSAPLMFIGVLALGITTMGRSQPSLQTEFRHGVDRLPLKGMPHQMLDVMGKRNGHHATPSPLRNVVSPQSTNHPLQFSDLGCLWILWP